MKNLIFVLAIFFSISAGAQTEVRDWTKIDCNGIPHNLYGELNGGKIIIMEFIMLHCTPCATAAMNIKKVTSAYETTHPGKIKLYSIGYDDSYTCPEMHEWKNDNKLDVTTFTEGNSEVEYYGGMGMPTVIVAGGTDHKLYYKSIGYVASDNNELKSALDNALGIASSIQPGNNKAVQLKIYPNPAKEQITVSAGIELADRYQVTDISGRVLLSGENKGTIELNIDINSLQNGFYFVHLINKDGIISRAPFVKTY